mmetsp:Transcript_7950/g.12174  ORF Transcript_7950/g.12174 Transcript_7950/m.12174 type:complete len:95 (+) Transcript_7950:1234-1518(+)
MPSISILCMKRIETSKIKLLQRLQPFSIQVTDFTIIYLMELINQDININTIIIMQMLPPSKRKVCLFPRLIASAANESSIIEVLPSGSERQVTV